MSASNAFETNILKLIFQNVNLANMGDATGLRGSSSAGVLYISLHTADPGEAGSQTTNEATFSSYARVSVARTSGAWDVTGDTVSNLAAITFPECDGGSNTITHFGIGSDSSGTGNLFFSGALGSSLIVSNGIAVVFGIGQLTTSAS